MASLIPELQLKKLATQNANRHRQTPQKPALSSQRTTKGAVSQDRGEEKRAEKLPKEIMAGNVSCIADGEVKWYGLHGKQFNGFVQGTNYETIPAVVPPGIYLREKKTVHTKACTQVFLAVLCTMANNQKQPDFLQQVNS